MTDIITMPTRVSSKLISQTYIAAAATAQQHSSSSTYTAGTLEQR